MRAQSRGLYPGSIVRLKNRVALITGSAHGIGRGIALAYAREGAKIVVNDLDRAPSVGHAADVVRLIGDAGGEVEVCLGDASETSDMERVMAATVERFGRLDILVNNANPGRRVLDASRTYLDVTEEQLYENYVRPFKAAFVNTQLAARRSSTRVASWRAASWAGLRVCINASPGPSGRRCTKYWTKRRARRRS